ncbi:uncharacterized protein LOC123878348 [Maniola jurtina]|uniref:uncharacterized protein LOC123878348 n=1 Tax=Maniola jurtina TaxID=191418 RepID=UPI001E68E5FD|nr:uncharacterized protein LOC123878348 [Maniola jurtina]
MKNQSEKDFKTKFRLLNSQENSEEIIWSYSDSSDYENRNQNENLGKANQTVNRKRKRGKTRKKAPKNISNLNITFVDTPVENKNDKKVDTSPVLQKVILSPLMSKSQQHFAPLNITKVFSSPILSSKSKNCSSYQNRTVKSPILLPNHTSPNISPYVRRKLFNNNDNVKNKSTCEENGRSKSPVLNCSPISNKSKLKELRSQNDAVKTIFKSHGADIRQEIIKSNNINPELNKTFKKTNLSKIIQVKNEINIGEQNVNDSLSTKSANGALFEKMKSYFDSHFSSETPSQQSISEYDTTSKNSSKTNEEIEIINSQTDKNCVPQIIKLGTRSSSDSLRSYDEEVETSKKVRYKKDGLAYRLSVLLKKQKSNVSLWQHERFLAANSNFVIPNDDFTPFRIQNVTIKYGCYLLEVIDVDGKKCFVLINHLNMNNSILEQCNIFKLYRPYKILDFNSDYKLIVNVSKFEFTVLDI